MNRYSQKEQQKEADSEDEMEVEKVSQKKKANKPKAEGMECEWLCFDRQRI